MSNEPTDVVLRAVRPGDEAILLELIRLLAEYERAPEQVTARTEDLSQALFCDRPQAEAVLAERGRGVLGFALFFTNFSTWTGRPGLYLEDLFVRPEARGQGLGKRLLLHLARLARDRGCQRMEWSVLDWNQPAIDFYRSLGAVAMEDWTVYRLDRAALDRLDS